MNFLDIILCFLGLFAILFILSGHKETFINPGEYPNQHEKTLLDLPKIKTRYCGLSKKNSCSKCNFLKNSSYAQNTNNDKKVWEDNSNLELTLYKRSSKAQPKPIEPIGKGLRINMFKSLC